MRTSYDVVVSFIGCCRADLDMRSSRDGEIEAEFPSFRSPVCALIDQTLAACSHTGCSAVRPACRVCLGTTLFGNVFCSWVLLTRVGSGIDAWRPFQICHGNGLGDI